MIDDVRFGCCMEPVNTMNVTRVAALLAGIPDSVSAVTVNRVCISGLEAVLSGMPMIGFGMADIILAVRVEHMSGAPYISLDAHWGCRLQDTTFVDGLTHGLQLRVLCHALIRRWPREVGHARDLDRCIAGQAARKGPR